MFHYLVPWLNEVLEWDMVIERNIGLEILLVLDSTKSKALL